MPVRRPTPVRSLPSENHRYDWVLAAPFRTHLRDLVSHSGIPWQAIAIHAGVPLRTGRSLLQGRFSRPMARLAPRIAEQLIAVTATALIALEHSRGSSELAAHWVRCLRGGGLSDRELALLAALLTTPIIAH